ncbi:MAG TPA: hypothetical protein VML94_07815 [Thermoplasmata archaeon]|nr:hypothetical protein [Thermoplasmata archaeon]
MAKRWVIGLVAAIAVVCMAGVGFSAFTAQAVVNGNASAASMDLQIVNTVAYGCYYNDSWTSYAPGNISFENENAALNEVTLTVANLTPGIDCRAALVLENTGSVPVNVSSLINTPGNDGVCTTAALDCYDVFTLSGIETNGWIWWDGSPTAGLSSYSYADFATLSPGHSVVDFIGVDIPPGSDDGTPGGAAFSLVYTATPEFGA